MRWKRASGLVLLGILVALGVRLALLRRGILYVEEHPEAVTQAVERAKRLVLSAEAALWARMGDQLVPLPTRNTTVEAEVVGVMSSVRVTQVFDNDSRQPIEAIYTFPLPEHAAVHAMTMTIGSRRITAEVRARQDAKRIYDEARRSGQTASLLTQERPNIFVQSVANIQPGDRIVVELRYVEELAPREGVYQFVFPLAVGPRYRGSIPPAPRTGTGAPDDVAIRLRLRTGVPITELHSASHRIAVRPLGSGAAAETEVVLDEHQVPHDRDFVVQYRLGGAMPRATLLTEGGAGGGHFLLLVQPKVRPVPEDIVPRHFVFVVDVSGSMSGLPLDREKEVLRRCLRELRPFPEDHFEVIRFAGSAKRYVPPAGLSPDERIARVLAFIDELDDDGWTEFLPALALALGPQPDPQRSRIIVFMSDGYIGYEAEVLRYLSQHLGRANLFAFGVGDSVNRYLIDGMARIGHGEPFVVLNRDDMGGVVDRVMRAVSRPALTHLEVDFGALEVSDVTPAVPPDLWADRPVVLTGRYRGLREPHNGDVPQVTLRGHLAGRTYEERLAVTLPIGDAAAGVGTVPELHDRHRPLAQLWARRQLGEWQLALDSGDGDGGALEQRITQLALEYGLLSAFTSFVAVDHQVRGRPGEATDEDGPAPSSPLAPPPSASLSHDRIAPGDPEVRVTAPPDAAQVTLLFPTGELKACRFEPASGQWVASFLIPEHTPDGIYTIRVLITSRSGAQLVRSVRYQVDGTAPRFALALEPAQPTLGAPVRVVLRPSELAAGSVRGADDIGDPGFDVRVREEIETAQAVLPDGTRAELEPQGDGRFALAFTAPSRPGRYTLAVVARDAARNPQREELRFDVSAKPPR